MHHGAISSMIRVRCSDGEASPTPPDCQAPPATSPAAVEPAWPAERAVTRQAPFVERLAYTRSQAAEALGVSRSTFIRRVLPYVETVEMPWGAKLIPVDELERLLAERRRPAKPRPAPTARGRPPRVPAEVIERIRAERAEGASLARIAAGLNADRTPTAHGGAQWWPSTIRSALARSDPPASPRRRANGRSARNLCNPAHQVAGVYRPDCCRTTSRSATRQEGRQHSRPRVPDGRAVSSTRV